MGRVHRGQFHLSTQHRAPCTFPNTAPASLRGARLVAGHLAWCCPCTTPGTVPGSAPERLRV